jgi:hypothetical protein
VPLLRRSDGKKIDVKSFEFSLKRRQKNCKKRKACYWRGSTTPTEILSIRPSKEGSCGHAKNLSCATDRPEWPIFADWPYLPRVDVERVFSQQPTGSRTHARNQRPQNPADCRFYGRKTRFWRELTSPASTILDAPQGGSTHQNPRQLDRASHLATSKVAISQTTSFARTGAGCR